MRRLAVFRLAFLLTFYSVASFAQGGPPMITDDPGTPGAGNWEINVAGLYSVGSSAHILQLPYFDINYGWGERIQLKIETGLGVAKIDSSPESGVETLLMGVKYRFVDEENSGISISTYPQFQFHTFFISTNPLLTEPGNQVILPFEFSKTVGDFELNADLGYICASEMSSGIFYGLLIAFEKPKPWEPLLELHINTNMNGSGSTILLNGGFRFALSGKMNLLFAIGHTLEEPIGINPDLSAYFGIQFH